MMNHLRLLSLFALLAGSVAAQTPSANTSILASKLQPFVDQHIMAGAVFLVADKNQVLDQGAVGYSDLAAQTPMEPDALFWIASMSKAMTSAAFMMLVDEGKVKLDDPVEKYIPDFAKLQVAGPNGALVPPSHAITIREILSHTGGLGFLNKTDKQVIDSVPLEVEIQHNLLEPLLSDPGTKYSYSNEGIDTAGRIIEIVSGIPYEQFLQDRLFTPLGMTDTTFNPTPDQLKRLAKSYKADKTDPAQPKLVELPIHFLKYPLGGPGHYPSPAGGLFSTAHDVCRFCQMLANGGTFEGKTYLSPEAVHAMTTKETGPLVPNKYGFGLQGSDDGSVFGHGGAYKTNMGVDHGLIQVFLVQQASAWASGDPGRDFTQAVHTLYAKSGARAASDAASVGTQVPPNPK